ncbi:C45 family autoproteolytic acyltransferase/hydolase [Anaeromicropila populeti]|uniref:Predicted choloylglycine hydrolase n=1 Tax=Anaeromicropila populeti TaxID=37658 RepID=A0A1I6L3W4_9FIRM|nr:C45 family peptidase [Anaeromicropila populeti]SFR98175.1 Predicted choloylglycine hydrolase [Anaeromicropila populeti]
MYHPRLKGNHYEMGKNYGQLLYKKGVTFDDILDISTEKMEFGMESLDICKEIYPEALDEVKGLSEGFNCSYEKFAAWLLSLYCFEDEHGCTCFCFKDREQIIFARNSDMFPDLKKTSESVLYRPNQGNYYIGHSTAMVVMEDGINEKGLAAGMTFLLSKEAKPGMNVGLLIKYILEKCNTVEEAVEALKSIPISSTQNIILADKSGDMRVVECSCNKMNIRKPAEEEYFVVATNEFKSNDMQGENGNPEENWYYSNNRYETVSQALKNKPVVAPVDYACDILSGKTGFVCQYEKKLKFDTIWSVVYELNTNKILCAEGNPKRKKFASDDRLEWGISKRR